MNQNNCINCGYMKEIHEGKNMKKTFALWLMALKISGSSNKGNIFFSAFITILFSNYPVNRNKPFPKGMVPKY